MSALARAPSGPYLAVSWSAWRVSSASEKSWSVSWAASSDAAPAPSIPASVPFAVRRSASIRNSRSWAVA